ncbi:tetratricopeptide repeat protein [Azospirillum sp. SYSU D00513]|uniref:tetratricopeptide repeat protein n=1 Tax=Azospirillum sp. SYSU D00513 TaxID=2812561 RepID=UPI001A9645AD|nr:tetratricopeptide repeat protein [Azospirillum sp. SYSU D00513]
MLAFFTMTSRSNPAALATSPDPLADAKAFFKAGRHAEAASQCRNVLKAGQSVVESLVLLGSIGTLTNTAQASIPLLQLAASLAPRDISALNALGLAYHENRQYSEACACFEQVLAIAPRQTEVMRNLAHAQFGRKDWAKALAMFAQLYAREEHALKDWIPHAGCLHHLKRNAEAIVLLQKFIELEPENADAWYLLGLCLHHTHQIRPAIEAYKKSIKFNPKKYTAYLNLAALYQKHSNPERAAAVCRTVLALNKDFLPIYVNYGLVLAALGKSREAVELMGRLLLAQPENDRCRSNVLFYSQYTDDVSPRRLYDIHREWDIRHGEPLRRFRQEHRNDPSPNRRLRIAYVSPDLKAHSCAWFLMDLLEHHDREAVEIYAYANLDRPDGVTERLKAKIDVWRDVNGLPDADLAQLIRQDQIDVLIDLAGHTARHSLIAFAHKPAPVQVTWLGYPGTTGLSTIDYRLSDAWLTPEGTPELFSETVYTLPRISHCFRPPEAPEPTSLPARTNGIITFGSFNNFAKLSDTTARLWTAALDRVPNAKLLLKSRHIGSEEAREAILGRFRRAGADLSRIVLASGNERQEDHLAQYGLIDIALDTFPYGGMTTTCESLWMGVPVISMAGDRTSGRYGASVLNAVGLGELVANGPEQFGEVAARLAGDLDRLVELRATLRQRMAKSPLCDGPAFARAMENAYRDMWARWCDSQKG